jgi:hypothetical protein
MSGRPATWGLVGLLWLLLSPPAALGVTPETGLWIGHKNNVQLSFTLRAKGSARYVTDGVVFCGSNSAPVGFSSQQLTRYPVLRSGRIEVWDPNHVRDKPAVSGGRRRASMPRRLSPVRVPCATSTTSPSSAARYVLSRMATTSARRSRSITSRGTSGATGSSSRSRTAMRRCPIRRLSCTTAAWVGLRRSDRCRWSGPPRRVRRRILLLDRRALRGPDDYRRFLHRVGQRRPVLVKGGSFGGSQGWSAELTKAAAGSVSPGHGPSRPPAPTEPKPAPHTGYGGPPVPSTAKGCQSKVEAGPLDARSACFRAHGEVSRSAGRVRLNGIDLTPARPGSSRHLDRRQPADVRHLLHRPGRGAHRTAVGAA